MWISTYNYNCILARLDRAESNISELKGKISEVECSNNMEIYDKVLFNYHIKYDRISIPIYKVVNKILDYLSLELKYVKPAQDNFEIGERG